MKNHGRKRILLFWTYDPNTDKTTITDGVNTEKYTGSNLSLFVMDFKEWHFITSPVSIVRY